MPTGVAWLAPGIESVMLLLIHEAVWLTTVQLVQPGGWLCSRRLVHDPIKERIPKDEEEDAQGLYKWGLGTGARQ